MRNDLRFASSDIDMALGVRRTGNNRQLYLRFLKQFPHDDSLPGLEQALAHGDLRSAFLCAHTLKGLSAQLGIGVLSASAAALCDLLRPQDPSVLPQARAACAALSMRYRQIVRQIECLSVDR